MFTLELQQNTLNLIRSLLPIDTGNLRYNGTTMTADKDQMDYKIGGVMADYVKFLENDTNSKHYKNISNVIAPTVFNYLDSYLNNLYDSKDFFENLGEELSVQEATNKLEERNEEFFSSLSRNNISVNDVLGR